MPVRSDQRMLHFPMSLALRIVFSILLYEKRDFRRDAQTALAANSQRITYEGLANIPQTGPLLVIINHYSRPQVSVIWAALAISSQLPQPPIWLMTSAWTKRQPGWDVLRTRLTTIIFARLAFIYGFITMPPMPPVVNEITDRAVSIRRLFKLVHQNPQSMICLAPEGQDSSDGTLGQPAQGTGRLVQQLAKKLKRILPVGVYDPNGCLFVRFGEVFSLTEANQDENADEQVSDELMQAIAALLPEHLRGRYNQIKGSHT